MSTEDRDWRCLDAQDTSRWSSKSPSRTKLSFKPNMLIIASSLLATANWDFLPVKSSLVFTQTLVSWVLIELETSCTNLGLYIHFIGTLQLTSLLSKDWEPLWEIFESSATRVFVLIMQEEDFLFLLSSFFVADWSTLRGIKVGCVLRGVKVWLDQARWRWTAGSQQVHRSP